MNKINVGIVGLGAISKNVHIPVLSTFEDVQIEAAAEIDVKRGRFIAKKWNISKVYENYNEMYERSNLDAVFICIPTFLHYDAVKMALENGIHVFCEKPMGLRSNDLSELVKVARKKDLVLAVGYNRRLEKNYEETGKIVKSLKLGHILQAHGILVNPGPYAGWIPSSEWFFHNKYGVLYDSGAHLMDLMMHVLSDKITEISAEGTRTMLGIEVLDNIAGVFKTQKGIVGSFNMGWKIATSYDSIQIHGTGGSVFANPLEIEVRSGGYGSLDRVMDHIKSAKTIIYTQITGMGGGKRPSKTYFREDRAFIDAVLNGSEPPASGENGHRVLKVLEAIKESIDKEKVIKINCKTNEDSAQ